MAGYSATPLVKKLGFKENLRVGLVNPPKGFQKELAPLPSDVSISVSNLTKPLDLISLFVDSQATLKKEFPRLARKLSQSGMLWVAWPKDPQTSPATFLTTAFATLDSAPDWSM